MGNMPIEGTVGAQNIAGEQWHTENRPQLE